MALICELASAIGIDDTQITFRIKDHEGVDLTTTEDGLKLVLAVNYMNSDDFTNNVGQDIGTIITLRHFNFSLGYGFEGGEFDYDGLFQGLEGLTGTGEGMFQYSQGDLFFNDWAIIQVFPAYGNLTGATFAAHGHSNNNYWGAANGSSYCPPESMAWEDGNENFSVLLTFILPPSVTNVEGALIWGQDEVKVNHSGQAYGYYGGLAGFQTNLGPAPFTGQLPIWSLSSVDINKEDFYGYEGCFGASFSLIDIDASNDFTVHKNIFSSPESPTISESPGSEVVCFQPYVWGETPVGSAPLNTYDFALAITDVDIPDTVVENETVNCSFVVLSLDFIGQVRVSIYGNWNPVFEDTYPDDILVNYGAIQFEGGGDTHMYLDVTEGGSTTISFTYTASDVGVNQTDSFYIFAKMDTLNQDAYGDDQANAQNQFDQLTEEQLTWFGITPSIVILDADEDDDVIVDPEPSDEGVIVKPSDIIYHLAKKELGYDKDIDSDSIDESRSNHENWDLGFCINKEIDSKKLIQEISQSSKSFSTFGNDRLKFITIKNTYNGNEEITTIKSAEVIKYNFSRTKIEDVKTQVEVKHKYDYGLKNHVETTGEIKINEHYVTNNSYWLTGTYNDLLQDTFTFNNYYGIKRTDTTIDHIDTFLTVENDYIRLPDLAERFARYLLYWHMNQHNIVELTLPIKYFALEIGDLIEFDEMILGKKVYGEHYVVKEQEDMPIRCGQYILPLFMITETSKSIKDIKIKAIQLHHMSDSQLSWKNQNYLDTTYTQILGDVNGDNILNILDIVKMVNHIIEYSELTGISLINADINQDEVVDVLDIVALINLIIDGQN